MKKIAISGSQCTGKTTLVNYLKTLPEFADYEFFVSMTRGINDAGVPINLDGTDDTQLLILSKHVERILSPRPNGVVLDRSIIDGFVYTYYLSTIGQISNVVVDIAYDLLECIIDRYDHIFYLPPEIKLEADGQRSVDTEFHNNIVVLFEHQIDLINRNYKDKITTIHGSVEHRAQSIIDYIRS